MFTKEKKENRVEAKSKEEIKEALKLILPSNLSNKDVVFACIGTDRSTGDSLGPMIGTFLESMGYENVIGTLHEPLHAKNLEERLSQITKDKTVIAIDACLGRIKSVGATIVREGYIKPGAGVDKDLPPVGEYSIDGIVNIAGFAPMLLLQSTRLSLVMDMSSDIANSISEVLPINPIERFLNK